MNELIITNGDEAADLLAASGRTASILPWRDILHEGPLAAKGLEALSDLRAQFLSQRFGFDFAEIRAEFGARDAVLRQHEHFERIEIWLEHDLYDQLQLAQLVDFFAAEGRSEGVFLVQADHFLGQERAETIGRFADRARELNPQMLSAGRAAWAELCADTPRPAFRRLFTAPGPFPFLVPAIRRFLEELPAPRTGLGRSESVLLKAIAEYEVTPKSLFPMVLAGEPAAFMGDWSFFRLLEDLAFVEEPLLAGLGERFQPFGEDDRRLAYLDSPLILTPFGRAVLAGMEDHVATNGIDRWWAGTRLYGYDVWRFDRAVGSLVAPAGPAHDGNGE